MYTSRAQRDILFGGREVTRSDLRSHSQHLKSLNRPLDDDLATSFTLPSRGIFQSLCYLPYSIDHTDDEGSAAPVSSVREAALGLSSSELGFGVRLAPRDGLRARQTSDRAQPQRGAITASQRML